MTGPLGDLSTSPQQNTLCWKHQARNNRDRSRTLQKETEALKAEIRRLKEDLYGKNQYALPVKDIHLYPLRKNIRSFLSSSP